MIFWKNCIVGKKSFNGHVIWTFDKPAEVWKPKFEYFNWKVHIDEEKFSFFFKKLTFWSNFSCRLRKFSSGTHANNSRQKSLFSSAQRPKNLKKNLSFPGKEVFLHGFPGHKKRCFDNSVSIFLLKSDFFLAQSANFLVKLISFSEKLFPSKCSSGHMECRFDTPVVMLSGEVKNFSCWKFNKMSKLYPYQQNYLSSECLLDMRFAFLATRPKKFC